MTGITLDQAASTYIKIRDAITARERELKDWKKDLQEKLVKLELFIMTKFNELGIETISTKAEGHTAFKTFKDSVTIEDKTAFKSFIAKVLLETLQPHMYKTCEGEWQPDGEADLAHNINTLLDSGAFEIMSISADKSNCKDYKDKHEGILPPGIKYTREDVIQVRKGKKKVKK